MLRKKGASQHHPSRSPRAHPLGISGARITGRVALELARSDGRRALSTMCIGVGQGIAVAPERVSGAAG